jgi:kynurenine formamidase
VGKRGGRIVSGSRVIDLSHPIDGEVPMFPGHPGPAVEEYLTREESASHYAGGTSFVIHRYGMLGNTGTYLDAPFHRFADGDDLGTLDLGRTVDLPGLVVDVTERVAGGDLAVDAAAIGDADVHDRAVLLRSGWDRRWPHADYLGTKPYLTNDGAARLRDEGAALVGIDTWNIDDAGDWARPAHSILLRVGIPIVENLRGLDALPGSGFRFFAAVLPFRGGSAIPVRAFALLDAV